MANCPKCNAHLKITNWRPECPKCGVNMVYYGMEERLLADAEKAEAEHARFQKKVDRLKASTVGGPLQIARIVFCILPLAGLFLPLAKISVGAAPFIEAHNIDVNILKLVDFFSGYLDINGLLGVINSELVGRAFTAFAVSIVLFALSIIMILLTLFRLLVSAKKKACVKNIVINVLAVALVAGSAIAFNIFAGDINAVFPAFITASVSYGAYIYAALFIPTIIANTIFTVHPMQVKYKEIDNYAAKSEEVKEAEEQISDELEADIEKKEEEAATK